MLQEGHAAHVQLPSLGHGGTAGYVGQQDGNAANGAMIAPPEQQAPEGIGVVLACEYSCLPLFQLVCQTKTRDDWRRLYSQLDFVLYYIFL